MHISICLPNSLKENKLTKHQKRNIQKKIETSMALTFKLEWNSNTKKKNK